MTTIYFSLITLTLVVIASLAIFVLSSATIIGARIAPQLERRPAENGLGQVVKKLFRHPWQNSGMRRWYTWEFPTRPGLGQLVPSSRFFVELPVNQQHIR